MSSSSGQCTSRAPSDLVDDAASMTNSDVEEEEGTPDRALFDAIRGDDLAAAKAALEAGGNPNRSFIASPVFSLVQSRELIELLYSCGAAVDKVKMSDPSRRLLLGLSGLRIGGDDLGDETDSSSPLDHVSKEQFDQGRARRFGTSNPEEMDVVFWRAMVNAGCDAYEARTRFIPEWMESPAVKPEEQPHGEGEGDEEQEPEANSKAGLETNTYAALNDLEAEDEEASVGESEADQVPKHDDASDKARTSLWGNPIWCCDRIGQSLTKLPDGTFVQIGGEHEDFYDPDFMIYNDVIVHHPDRTRECPKFTIFGYPNDVFPPTDFHTATYVPAQNAIYVIGNMGHRTEANTAMKKSGETPVYRLHIGLWKLEKVETTGDGPGWISNHRAQMEGNKIRIMGNDSKHFGNTQRYIVEEGKETSIKVGSDEWWVLDLETMTWANGNQKASFTMAGSAARLDSRGSESEGGGWSCAVM